MFELIQKYYKMGIYTDANLETYVKSGAITPEQATDIKGGSHNTTVQSSQIAADV